METWIFEPGHTEAEFRARHMMVTWVRGLFKDIHGWLEFGWDRCLEAKFGERSTRPGFGPGSPTVTNTCEAPTSSMSPTTRRSRSLAGSRSEPARLRSRARSS
jgi:hypothetical protein